jgi:hypothetical protein
MLRKNSRYSESDTSSERSSSNSLSSDSEGSDDSSVSPCRTSSHRRSRKEPDRPKPKVKVEVLEDTEAKQLMKNIHKSLEAIKVNMAEPRAPRRAVPTNRSNVWCTKCEGAGHYSNECRSSPSKSVHFVNTEGSMYFTVPEINEEANVYTWRQPLGEGNPATPQQLFQMPNPAFRP